MKLTGLVRLHHIKMIRNAKSKACVKALSFQEKSMIEVLFGRI